jgi:hypothetical protein
MKSASVPLKNSKPVSNLPKKSAHAKGCRPPDKAVRTENWKDIFGMAKCLISFAPSDMENNDINIRKCSALSSYILGLPCAPLLSVPSDSEFGFNPLKLSDLYGNATSRDIDLQLKLAMLKGETIMLFVNLYRIEDGRVLSCHTTLRCLPISAHLTHRKRTTYWAMLTIRSASSVGNANFIGVGLLGIDRIERSKLQQLIGSNSLEQQHSGDTRQESHSFDDSNQATPLSLPLPLPLPQLAHRHAQHQPSSVIVRQAASEEETELQAEMDSREELVDNLLFLSSLQPAEVVCFDDTTK